MKRRLIVVKSNSAEDKVVNFAPGDTIKVYIKITEGEKTRIQMFEGVVIRKRGAGISASFTVRRVSYGEGAERTFPIHSPIIDQIKLVRKGRVRRAKLYYLRDRVGKRAKIAEKKEVETVVNYTQT